MYVCCLLFVCVYTTHRSAKSASSTRENDRQISWVNVKLGGSARQGRKAVMVVNMHNRMETSRLDATGVSEDKLYGYSALRIGLLTGRRPRLAARKSSICTNNVRIGSGSLRWQLFVMRCWDTPWWW